jgi:predicted DNA binding CopG/RHH family protein
MSIRVSERERREIEEKAAATGMTPSAYIRTMALDGGNVDTTSHEDRQKADV